MAKSIVNTALPIEFSEICEVVNQDLAGVNGRSLFGAGGQFAIATGIFDPVYVGSKDRISNFRGYKHVFTSSVYVASIPNQTGMINPSNMLGAANETYMCYDIVNGGGTYYGLQLQPFSIPIGATIIASQLFSKVSANTNAAISEEAQVIMDSVGTLVAQYGFFSTNAQRLTTIATSYTSGYSAVPAALTVARANAGLIVYPQWLNQIASTVRVCTDYYKLQLWWTV